MTFTLECKNGKFNLENLQLNKITDTFTITKISDKLFSLTNGEFVFSLSAHDDDYISMYTSVSRRIFLSTGKRFVIYCYESFDNIHLYDNDGRIAFSVGVDK